jgi:hypothetical protein
MKKNGTAYFTLTATRAPARGPHLLCQSNYVNRCQLTSRSCVKIIFSQRWLKTPVDAPFMHSFDESVNKNRRPVEKKYLIDIM